jgi:putative MATE family efflux protein
MRKLLLGDREFYKGLIGLTLPIALQNLLMSALNLVDTVMIGQLGETEIASVALANQVFFLLVLFLFGVSSGASIFCAQFWGRRDIANIRRVLGLGICCNGVVALLFTVVSLFFPRDILGLYTEDIAVIGLGSSYLRIVSVSFIMTAISFSFSFALRSTGNAKLPMIVSFFAIIINTVLNYILIFGKLGFPALGVEGAAIATAAARFSEIILILLAVYSKRLVPAASIKELLDLKLVFIGRFFRAVTPVIFNEVLWSTGVTMYSMVYARMGTGIIASVNIASTVERIAMVLFMGMANACAVMVGNKIGEGDEKTAFIYAKRLALIGPSLGVLFGIIVIASTGFVLSFYNVTRVVYEAARSVLCIFSVIMPVKIFNMINIVGILRSGGDTKFSLFLDAAGVWLIAVPLAFLGGLVWSLPLYIVYMLVNIEEVFKLFLGLRRFMSRRWINNLVKQA